MLPFYPIQQIQIASGSDDPIYLDRFRQAADDCRRKVQAGDAVQLVEGILRLRAQGFELVGVFDGLGGLDLAEGLFPIAANDLRIGLALRLLSGLPSSRDVLFVILCQSTLVVDRGRDGNDDQRDGDGNENHGPAG